MHRRQFNQSLAGAATLWLLLAQRQAWALSLADLSERDASSGLRAALEQAALAAVGLLGRPDGFLGNPKVRIGLPKFLEQGATYLRLAGQGRRLDELVTSMNRAAEAAVPMGQTLLVGAVKTMSVSDAKQILTGGEQSVTRFFVDKTRAPLGQQFLPVVTRATEKVGLINKYNKLAGKAAQFGLMKPQDANVQTYVTGKTLDGLYTIIGEQELKIRQDPIGTGSALLTKVFGALK